MGLNFQHFSGPMKRGGALGLALALGVGGLTGFQDAPLSLLLVWLASSAAAILLLLRYRGKGSGELKVGSRPGARVPLLFTGVAMAWNLAAGLWMRFSVLENLPRYYDETVYLFQSRLFAAGYLSLPSVPEARFLYYPFILNREQGFAGGFPPGWPLALVPGQLLGIPWLVPHLVSLAAVLVISRLAETLASRDGAPAPLVRAGAAWLVGTSPWLILMSATWFSHGLSLVLTATVLLAALKLSRGGTGRWIPVLGSALGLLMLTRPLNAALLALTLALWGLGSLLRSRAQVFTRLVAAAMLTLPLVGGLLWYNNRITGDPLVFPIEEYFRATELEPGCHSLGFGPDRRCVLHHYKDFFGRIRGAGFTPADGLEVTLTRLRHFLGDAGGADQAWLFLIPLLLLVVVRPGARRGGSGAGLLLGVAAIQVLGYGLFYFHGINFGARFYFETLACLIPLACLGFSGLRGQSRVSLVLVGLAVGPWLAAPATTLVQARTWEEEIPLAPPPRVEQLLPQGSGPRAVLVSRLEDFGYVFNLNPITEQGFLGQDLFFLEESGDPVQRPVLEPERALFRLVPGGASLDPVPPGKPGPLRLVLSTFWPFWNRDGMVCSLAPQPGGAWGLVCRLQQERGFISMTMDLPSGPHRISLALKPGENLASVDLVLAERPLSPVGMSRGPDGVVLDFGVQDLAPGPGPVLLVARTRGPGEAWFSPSTLTIEPLASGPGPHTRQD